MKRTLGFCVAMLATASFAIAGGNGDDKKGDKKKGGAKKEAATPTVDGWSGGPGKGFTYSKEDFSLTLKSRGQVAFNYNNIDGAPDNLGFNVRRARTTFSGNINENVTYKLQTEWTEGTSIKDLYIDWRFHNTASYDMGLRVGQQKIAFGNDWKTSSGELEFVDRGLTTRTFSNSRSRGATLHGDMGQGSDGGNVGWSVSAFNSELAAAAANSGEEGDGRAGAVNDNADDDWNYNAEVHWSRKAKAGLGASQGDNHDGQSAFGAGLSFYHGNGNTTVATVVTDVETDSLNANASWRSGSGIAVSGEYFTRSESLSGGAGDNDSSGYQVACTWVAAPNPGHNQWGVGLRYSAVDVDAGQNLLTGGLVGVGGDATELEAVVNIFHDGHNLKTQFGVTMQEVDMTGGGSMDNVLLSIQNTFVF